MKSRRKAFTMVELITVVSIIAILLGVLIPSITKVRNSAKEAKQKAQFTKLDMAIMTFKNDFGDYPESNSQNGALGDYEGTQKLTEALVGQDLLGYHPDSDFNPDELQTKTVNGTPIPIYPGFNDPGFNPTGGDKVEFEDSIRKRVGPYIEASSSNAYTIEDLFDHTRDGTGALIPASHVICDTFEYRKIEIGDTGKYVKVGTPVLYYRANTANKKMDAGDYAGSIYDVTDNQGLYEIDRPEPGGDQKEHLFNNSNGYYSGVSNEAIFYDQDVYKLIDPKVSKTNWKWPYRAESYILISAGLDGLYGTEDDIMNFDK